MKLQQIHLRINDAATGQPTPVRLRITDAEGKYYAPYGRLTEFAIDGNQDVGGNVMIDRKKWAYIDGTCEILLPPSTLHIEVAKGPEYKPIDEDIQLLAGKLALRLQIERWSDVRKQGWYSGDMDVSFLSPDASLLEGQAEDVAVVNLLVEERRFKSEMNAWAKVIPNIVSFSGQSFAREAGGCGVAVNTFNFRPGLSGLGLLHCHRIVYPLAVDASDDEWTLEDWSDQCHRKNGLVTGFSGGPGTDFRSWETFAHLTLGKVDAFVLGPGDAWDRKKIRVASSLGFLYELFNMEMIAALTGASGKRDHGQAIASMRTYAYIPANQEFRYSNWIEAIRAGRTFVSNGPLIHFTINGEVPTRAHRTSVSANKMQIRAEARSATPYDQLELIWNGEAIHTVVAEKSFPYQVALEYEFAARESGWLAVRCVVDEAAGPAPHSLAHTSPVAVCVAESPHWAKVDIVRAKLKQLDEAIAWTRTRTHPPRPRLIHLYEQARTILAKKLSP